MERKRVRCLAAMLVVTLMAALLFTGVMCEADVEDEAVPQKKAYELSKDNQFAIQPADVAIAPLAQTVYQLPLALPDELVGAAEEEQIERNEKQMLTAAPEEQEPAVDEKTLQEGTDTQAEDEVTAEAEIVTVTEDGAEGEVETPSYETVSTGDPVERMLELVNGHRAQNGMAALTLDSTLCSAAATRASEITRNFSHTRPDGSQWYTVTSLAHGENLVMGTGMDADVATRELMNSAGHRANILDSRYATLGVGYCYFGSEVYWVQLFGY